MLIKIFNFKKIVPFWDCNILKNFLQLIQTNLGKINLFSSIGRTLLDKNKGSNPLKDSKNRFHFMIVIFAKKLQLIQT